MKKTLTLVLLLTATALFAVDRSVATTSNPDAPRIPADKDAPLIVEIPVDQMDVPPPFGTVVQAWNLTMTGGYRGSGITWRRDSGRFYLMDQGGKMWSLEPTNPVGTIRDETWTFPNIGGSTADIPWGLAWDDDSGCFWLSNITDGNIYGGCNILRMTPSGTWTGDSWLVGDGSGGGAGNMYWMGGMEKWVDRGYFCCAPVAPSPSVYNYVWKFDPYTKTSLGHCSSGDQTSERGCGLVPWDSLYILTTGWNANTWVKRDTNGVALQTVTATVYGPADWAVEVPQTVNPNDTCYVWCMCNNSTNTLQKLSTGMTWGQLPSVNRTSVRPTAVLAPVGAVDSGAVTTPTLVVRNMANDSTADSVHVTFEIRDLGNTLIYTDQTYILNLSPATSETLEFTSWVPTSLESLNVIAWTYWHGDSVTQDDTIHSGFRVRVRDVAVTMILQPPSVADSGSWYNPSCRVSNQGTQPETFNVNFRIGVYNSNVLVNNLPPLYSRVVTAADSWQALPGQWLHQVTAEIAGDMRPENNVMYDTINVAGTVGHDVAVEEVLSPTGFYPPGQMFFPSARVANYGGSPETFWTWFTIWDPVGTQIYHESLQVNLGGGAVTNMNFPGTDTLTELGSYMGRCSTYLYSDQNNLNDILYEPFALTSDDHNVLVRSIVAPSGTVDSGLPLIPTIVVQNGGMSTENFPCYIEIGSYSDNANVIDLAPGTVDTIEFDQWRPMSVGSQTVTAWTALVGDARPEDDTLSEEFFVRLKDVGAEQIIAPVGDQPETTWVHPEVRVRNYGSTTETFDVDFRIGLWLSTATVTSLAPDNYADVVMPDSYYTQVGIWLSRAQTLLSGDNNLANDVAIDTFTVAGTVTHDPAAVEVIYPSGTVQPNQPLTPRGVFTNYGLVSETFEAHFRVLDEVGTEMYAQYVDLTLDVGVTDTVVYPVFQLTTAGNYTAVCSTFLDIDQNWTNNVVTREFRVAGQTTWPPGWVEVESMPTGGGRAVKDGGWLAIDPATKLIYGTKGYKTGEFYCYDASEGEMGHWTTLAPFPAGVEGKLLRKGSRGVCDGAGLLYATKGNNTLGFWVYDIMQDTWGALPDVPEGPSRKKVKGGTDMVYVEKDDVGYVYLMKGYKTEFYRYNTLSHTWEAMPDVPPGPRGKWQKGSWLCLMPTGGPVPGWPLYAHHARYYNRTTDHHYMYRYDVEQDSWSSETFKGMPLYGLHGGRIRKKKSKDGSAGAEFGNAIYALKGGNSQQFFKYFPRSDSWAELETMPSYGTTGRKKRVKYGADFVSWGSGAFFALKGNKTRETWRYVLPAAYGKQPERSGALAGRTGNVPTGLTVAPNPLVGGRATVRYSLPQAGPASIVVYDVTGRGVLRRSVMASRTGSVSLDVRNLSAGVYLVRVESSDWQATRKLVIE